MKTLYSMTGYAETGAVVAGSDLGLRVELRSVNGRFLDLGFRLPDEVRAGEPLLRSMLGAALRRGKVECRVSLEHAQTAPAMPSPAQVEPLLQAEAELLQRAPHLRGLSVADVWRLASGLQQSRPAPQALLNALQQAAAAALQGLQTARADEGGRLRSYLLERCAALRELAIQAQRVAPQATLRQQERFTARWNEALAAQGAVSDPGAGQDRLLQEVTAFALRVDVAEEIARLQSHLDAIETLLKDGGEAGKRLDFLIQELHREANTLGSKSAVLELSEIAVNMKVCIEQMREQVQNLE